MTAIPWDTIESVRLAISHLYIGPTDEKHEKRGLKLDCWNYTFQYSVGKRVVFKGQSGIQSLRYVVEKEVKVRFLPEAIATYESGLPVCFGDIEVSQQGIRIGQQAVAWKNILYVDMQRDLIKIRLPDGEHWIGTDKAGIPNDCVFEEIVHQVIG